MDILFIPSVAFDNPYKVDVPPTTAALKNTIGAAVPAIAKIFF